MQATHAFRMADLVTDGNLVGILTERRAQRNQGFEQIARELYAEFGIEVTRQTLSNWWDAIEAKSVDPSGCVPAPGGSSTPEAAA